MERLNGNPLFLNRLKNKRAVRERYALLAKKFKQKMAEEEKASGISPEPSEIEKLLEEIVERFEEADCEAAEKSQKADKDKAKAEEMRRRSMEKLGDTMKRKADETGESGRVKRRASGSETVVYLKEKADQRLL